MNKHISSLFIFIALSLCLSVSSSSAEESRKFLVTTSISPYDFFIKKIAGDLVDIYTLIPQGAEHETFEPGLSKISKVTLSELFIAVNPQFFEFEKKLEGHLKDLPKNKTIILDSSNGITIASNDPHIWTSPQKVKIILTNILAGLKQALPEQGKLLENNLSLFNREIDDSYFNSKNLLQAFSGKTFYTYHGSWGYFAEDFKLTNAYIDSEGRETSLAHQNKLLKRMLEDKAHLIILDNPEQEEKLSFLKSYINLKTVVVSAQEYNWLDTQKRLTDILTKNFNANR